MWGFAVWNGWVPSLHGVGFQRGRPARTLRPTTARMDHTLGCIVLWVRLYAWLDCWITGWKKKEDLDMLGRKALAGKKRYFAEFLCRKEGKEYVVTVPGYFETKEEAEIRLTKYSVFYFSSKSKKGTEYLGSNIYSKFVCG